MEIITIVASILQVMSISLGVGSSTLAVLNFFSAIADVAIDETERRMMGVTYVVLRIAMVIILATTAILAVYGYSDQGISYFTNYILAQYTLIFVLFFNAFLMTKRIMPSTFGPAIQAGTWYLLGLGTALFMLELVNFTWLTFIIIYLAELAFAYLLINGAMLHLKKKRP